MNIIKQIENDIIKIKQEDIVDGYKELDYDTTIKDLVCFDGEDNDYEITVYVGQDNVRIWCCNKTYNVTDCWDSKFDINECVQDKKDDLIDVLYELKQFMGLNIH